MDERKVIVRTYARRLWYWAGAETQPLDAAFIDCIGFSASECRLLDSIEQDFHRDHPPLDVFLGVIVKDRDPNDSPVSYGDGSGLGLS